MIMMKRKAGIFIMGIIFLILGITIVISGLGAASDKTRETSSYYSSSSSTGDLLALPEYLLSTNGVLIACTGIILMAVSEERQYKDNMNYSIPKTPPYNNQYVCPNCHTVVPANSAFCQGCGFKINQAAQKYEKFSQLQTSNSAYSNNNSQNG